MADIIKTRFGSGVAKGVKKEVTKADGTVTTTMDNGQVKSDFRNREPQVPEQAPVQPTPTEPIAPTTPVNEPVQAPIQETPVVAPVEPVKAPEVKPVSVPTTPKTEQTPEEKKLAEVNIKTQENNLKTQEQAQNEASKEQAKAGFQSLIDNGANAQQMADYVRENEAYRKDFAYIAKSAFKNKANAGFFNKYSGMSTEGLYSAIKNGEVVMYSEKYNLLPEEQRKALESYKTVKEAPAGIPTTKEEVFNAETPENKVDFSNIENFMAKMFSSDLKGKMEAMRNDDRVVNLNTKLNAKGSEIEKFDLEGIKASKKLQDDLANAGVIPAVVRATVADYTANRAIERMSMVSDYNRIQGDLASVKDDLEYDMELFKIEDAQAKEKYSMLFSIYESRRAEGLAAKSKLEDRAFQRELIGEEREFAIKQKEADRDFTRELTNEERVYDALKIENAQDFQFAMAEFEAENKRIATEKALQSSKELYKFQNEIAQGNIKGSWENRSDGLYFLTDKGEATLVVNGNTQVNNDGTSIYTYVGENGQPVVEYRDINGNTIGASTSTTQLSQTQVDLLNAPAGTIIPTRLGVVTNKNRGKECAEYINDIFAKEIGARMGSTYASKLAVANEKTGGVGSVVVWQPNPNGEYAKFGHAGVIVGESADGKSWHVKSSNLNIDGTISVDEVPKDVIDGYKSTSLFNTPSTSKFSGGQVKQMDSLDPSKINSTDIQALEDNGISISDFYAYRAENKISPQDKSKMQAVLDGLQTLKGEDGTFESAPGFGGALGKAKSKVPFSSSLLPGGKAADYKNKADSVLNNLVLENLGLMSGVLTDSDIAILRSAATNINTDTSSEAGFAEGLKTMEAKYKQALGIEEPFFSQDGVDYSKEDLQDEIAQQLKDGKVTPDEVKQWLLDNNIDLN